jgi:D-threo-aldose 1-dehydrogenase
MPDVTRAAGWLRPLGSTGLMVSAVALGAAPLGAMPEAFGCEVPEERAYATVRAVLQSPINFLDTSANYGEGRSESRIGKVLSELGGRPAGVVLATKADRSERDEGPGEFSAAQMTRSIEMSLRRLGIGTLQLAYLHDPEWATFDHVTQKGGALEALIRLKHEGVIDHLGVAGGPIALMERYVATGAFEVVLTHNRFTLVDQSAEPLIAMAWSRGIAVVNAAPFARGAG